MDKVRILLADDHQVVRRGVRAIIESQTGWEVVAEASDGRDAVERVAQHKPDIVLLDIGMPGLNGLDATRAILKTFPQTEVLILTMHQSEELVHEVLRAGARGYVLKSDADSNLVAAINALLEHKPFLTPAVTEKVLVDYLEGSTPTEIRPRSRLTARERQIVQLLAEGKSNKEVATALDVAVRTVETHRINIMHKMGFGSLSDLVHFAIRNKIVDP